MLPLDELEAELQKRAAQGLLRDDVPQLPQAHEIIACSNDYLGLARLGFDASCHGGAGASRLVTGDTMEHRRAEAALSSWLQVESTLLFSAGYTANLSLLASVPASAVIFSDSHNHASIIDGCRLSRAPVEVYPHLDLDALEAGLSARTHPGSAWVVTESYFSMDADGPDLRRLASICAANDAGLIVDEAHAIGVFGPNGRGRCAEFGVTPDVLVGTLGKALGLQGAFIAGSKVLRRWLWNSGRGFVFSTGLSPALAAGVAERVHQVSEAHAARECLHQNADRLRGGLLALGADVWGFGPIVPWVVGEPVIAMRLHKRMREGGVLVSPMRPPTVPVGTSRLRLTVQANHTEPEMEQILAAAARARAEERFT